MPVGSVLYLSVAPNIGITQGAGHVAFRNLQDDGLAPRAAPGGGKPPEIFVKDAVHFLLGCAGATVARNTARAARIFAGLVSDDTGSTLFEDVVRLVEQHRDPKQIQDRPLRMLFVNSQFAPKAEIDYGLGNKVTSRTVYRPKAKGKTALTRNPETLPGELIRATVVDGEIFRVLADLFKADETAP